MIKLDNKYVGAAWLEDITEVDAKLGIYISEPGFRGNGIGTKVIQALISKAFNECGLDKVYLNVRGNNERAIKCYKNCGFDITERFDNITYPDGSEGSALRMSLNRG